MDEFEQNDEKETNDSHNTCIHCAFANLKHCPSTQQHMFLDESIVT